MPHSIRFCTLVLCCLLATAPGAASSKTIHRHSTHRFATQAPHALVEDEILKGKMILAKNDPEKILGDPYLVSAFYYSSHFLARMENRKIPPRDPQNRVVGTLGLLITPQLRASYIETLESLGGRIKEEPAAGGRIMPLRSFSLGRCPPCHGDAIDLFTREGSPVYSVADGIVVLAAEGWGTGNPFATVSRKGGNEVIIFDPATDRFYRYCHLNQLSVGVHNLVTKGQAIGTVGHTGLNASKKNHGNHLHFEINQYDPSTRSMAFVPRTRLLELLIK